MTTRPHEPLVPPTWSALVAWYAPNALTAAIVLGSAQRGVAARVAVAIGIFAASRWLAEHASLVAGRSTESLRRATLFASLGVQAAASRAFVGGAYDSPLANALDHLVPVLAALAAATSVGTLGAVVGLGGLGAARDVAGLGTSARTQRWTARVAAGGWLASAALSVVLTRDATPLETRFQAAFLGAFTIAVAASAVVWGSARVRRALELEARERLDLIAISAGLAAVVVCVVLTVAAPGSTLTVLLASPVALGVAVGVLAAQLADDVDRAVRRAVEGACVAGAVGAVGIVAAATRVSTATPSTNAWAMTALVALVAPSAALALARAQRPWTDARRHRAAVASAARAVQSSDPRDGVRGVLVAARAAIAPPGSLDRAPSPRLVLVDPHEERWLDRAGELVASQDGALPEGLFALLSSEPLGVVRAEVLRARAVTHAELRASLRWLERHDAACAVAVVGDGELLGALLCGDARDDEHVSLSAARAVATLAATVATRLALDAAHARAVARAHRAGLDATDARAAAERAERSLAQLDGVRAHDLEARTRPAVLRAYAPASRLVHDALTSAARGRALAVVHPLTVDPLPYVALWHARARRTGALVVLDAASLRALATADARADAIEGHVRAANEGTLAILAIDRLSTEDSATLVDALDAQQERRAAVATLRAFAFDAARPAARRIEPISSRLAPPDAPSVVLSPLRERLEDLHTVSLDHLAHLGAHLDGDAFGLSDDALARLLAYEWPGDDAELAVVLTRALLRLLEGNATSAGPERRRLEAHDFVGLLPPGHVVSPSPTHTRGARSP